MLEANDMVEAKLAEIREKKLYEMKRMFAAESESGPYGTGGTTKSLASGKYRLLTPAERGKGVSFDPSIKPGGPEHPFGVKSTEEKPKSKPKPKKSGEKGPIGKRWEKEKQRWSDRLDKLSARHLSKHDVEGGKSTWQRSVGGKAAAATSFVGKNTGKIVKGALGSDLASELRSIGTSNLR